MFGSKAVSFELLLGLLERRVFCVQLLRGACEQPICLHYVQPSSSFHIELIAYCSHIMQN